MSVADEAKLIELAARPGKDLFPILDRSASLAPLLVVLTFLPGLVALQSASSDELDAQWRLRSLELSSAPSAFDAVDTARQSFEPALKWQPPLASWIAAAAVNLPWPIGPHGLELCDYLFAAALVPATYLLIARLMGKRSGFVAALLVAFHSTFLEQHQHATPHALAVVTALCAFSGFLGHLYRTDGLVSLHLLFGGISLGLCLLAGGPLSFAVVLILVFLLIGHFEPPLESRAGSFRSRRARSLWVGYRSLGVLVATAFAAGGWWVLMMLYTYGGDFWAGWLSGVPAAGAVTEPDPFSASSLAVRQVRMFFATTRVLSGLTLIGMGIVVNDLVRPPTDSPAPSRKFLASWTGCALLLTANALRDPGEPSLYLDMWRLLLMSACIGCSALAIEAIARRRVGVGLFVGVTVASLAVGYLFLHGGSIVAGPSAWAVAIAVVPALVAARLMQRFSASSELRRQLVLICLTSVCVVTDALVGFSSIRARDPEATGLAIFRRGLPTAIDPEACVLISESAPPSRLQLALKSAWPNAQLSVARDWDDALKSAVGERRTLKTAIVVDWSKGNSRPANPTGEQWQAEPVGNPQFFERRQLRAYVLVWERGSSAAIPAPGNRVANGPSQVSGTGR